MFDWMELEVFEMQLLELQSSSIWRKKYVDLRVRPQIINYTWSLQWISLELQLSAENEVLSVLSELLEAFNSMKQVAVAIVLILSFS